MPPLGHPEGCLNTSLQGQDMPKGRGSGPTAPGTSGVAVAASPYKGMDPS